MHTSIHTAAEKMSEPVAIGKTNFKVLHNNNIRHFDDTSHDVMTKLSPPVSA